MQRKILALGRKEWVSNILDRIDDLLKRIAKKYGSEYKITYDDIINNINYFPEKVDKEYLDKVKNEFTDDGLLPNGQYYLLNILVNLYRPSTELIKLFVKECNIEYLPQMMQFLDIHASQSLNLYLAMKIYTSIKSIELAMKKLSPEFCKRVFEIENTITDVDKKIIAFELRGNLKERGIKKL